MTSEPYPNLVNSLNRQELKQSYIKQQAELENQDRNKRIPKKHNVFRIMTYNVYGFNFFKNSANEIKKIIDILDPDIINFQEFNNGFNIDGYRQFYKLTMDNEDNGLGVLNKIEHDKNTLYSSHIIPKDNIIWSNYVKDNKIQVISDNDIRSFIHTQLNIEKGNNIIQINIINTHLDVWDETGKTRFYEINVIVQYIQKHGLKNVILLGDFNDINMDLLPKTLISELEINFKRRVPQVKIIPTDTFNYLNKVGFIDSYKYINKPSPLYSCWTGRKVDHILFYKPTWNLDVSNVYIHYNNYSDHLPLILDINL